MSTANIIREMGFVKGFRLKNLSLNVKPLNLRGSGRRDDLDQRDQRDQSEVSDIRDQRDQRDNRDQSEVAINRMSATISLVSLVPLVPLVSSPFCPLKNQTKKRASTKSRPL